MLLDEEKMQALVLAGGKGTRLRPLTVYTPKPIVPLLNRPFLLYQIETLAKAGIRDIVLSLGYQPDKIEDVLGDGSDFGVNLRYVTEPSPLGTGGAYKFASESIRDTTVVFNGDILTDLDLSRVIEFHRNHNAEATLTLVSVEDPSGYGLVEVGSDSRIKQFLEKPSEKDRSVLGVDTINAGVYILEPTILDLIPKNENRSFEYDVFPLILASNRDFLGFVAENIYWRDLGNPQSYKTAHLDFINGRVSGFDIDRNSTADIATTAFVDKLSVVGDGCVIKPGSRIVRSTLGPGVHVDEKTVIEESVIWGHTRILGGTEIRNSFVGRSCHIGRNVVLAERTVLGDKTTVADYSKCQMPELPEVEIVARTLHKLVSDRIIVSAQLLRKRLAPDNTTGQFKKLAGSSIRGVSRRGKHLLINLSNDSTLIVHLRMSGRFSILSPEAPDPKFTHAIFFLDHDERLVFDDQRHFGFMKIVKTARLSAARELEKLAPEPFGDDFSDDYLFTTLRSSRRTIKEILIDQTKVCGLGNIYAAEVLFLSGVHPEQRADTISRRKISLLTTNIRAVLNEAIAFGETLSIDKSSISGSIYGGDSIWPWFVYDREGKPCHKCDSRIGRVKQAGRSTYFCSSCQKKTYR